MNDEDPQQILEGMLPGQRIVDTTVGRENGLNKCPTCGGSEIRYVVQKHALVCSYCRHEWNEPNAEKLFGLDSEIDQLRGRTIASGTSDIQEDVSVVTLKCDGCGAEVVISVDETAQARCHWCRQVLSVNRQVPNGAVPDAVLPFGLTREQAVQKIAEFAGKRQTFANARFKREFVPENVMGVYIPYMVVDATLKAKVEGAGEVTTRQWTERRKVGDDYVTETFYDADVFAVGRRFDMDVDDLTVVSAERFDAQDTSAATNNILAAVQPYDLKEAVAYNSNYLVGFTSERRDLNVDDVDDRIEEKLLSIARAKAEPTVSRYDRGVRWEREGVDLEGSRWVSIYVPVWLYSYADSARGGELIHYIAVNARTGATMGSVPVSHGKIALASCGASALAGVIATVVTLGVMFT